MGCDCPEDDCLGGACPGDGCSRAFVRDITFVQQTEVILIYIKCDGVIVVIASVETNTYTNVVH